MTPTRVASPEYILVFSDMEYYSEPAEGLYYPSTNSPDSVWTQYMSLSSVTLGFVIRKVQNPSNPNQSRWFVSYRESSLNYVNFGYLDANVPQFFPAIGEYNTVRPGYLLIDLPEPTPTPTPTPTNSPFLGVPISNSFIAVNYGNVNSDFGTNTTVVRDPGYDPDVAYYYEGVNGNLNRAAYLNYNIDLEGCWWFGLENRITGRSYSWKNDSINSNFIPITGWYGYNYSWFLSGNTNLTLSATVAPATPTPTPTQTNTPSPTYTPFLYDRASKASIQESYNILKNINNPTKNYTNFSLLCTLGFNNFCNDWSGTKREWNPNFWGYPYRNILDFSGVSLNTEMNATLITPQHFVSNTHFAPTLSCCFYDHNTGDALILKIKDFRTFGEDCFVGKLATPIPAASAIKIYKIAASTSDIPLNANQFPLFYLGGKAFTTNNDCFHGGCVGSTKYTPYPQFFNRSYINTYSDSLPAISSIFTGKDFASNGINVGESCNPMFILLNNELHLHGTFYYPDFGPWWGCSTTLAQVASAIIEMGSEGYSLTAVYLNNYS
jgi:hypothetical protein